MKVMLESTSKITFLVVNGEEVPARVWEGTTESGIPCHAYITRIAVNAQHDAAEFERDLRETRPPSADLARAIPMRMVL
ncbi:MAG: hypothetical protein IPK75_18235 [Acidobacteria bacterium]|nr:hypothetical protein [Acidobacteriota bacterium]